MLPGWVKSGKLEAGDATYQLKVMEAIVRTLMQLDAEQRQLSLFDTKASAVPYGRNDGIHDGLCRREFSNIERNPQVS